MLVQALVLLLGFARLGASYQSVETQKLVARFLPAGAKIESFYTPRSTTLAAGIGRLRGTGSFLAMIYKAPGGALALRVVEDPSSRPNIVAHPLPGGVVWSKTAWSAGGFQLLDLSGDGNDYVITITGIGASLGASLRVFKVLPGRVTDVSATPSGEEIGGYGFTFERGSPSSAYSLVVYGKWIDATDSTVLRYAWNGQRFQRTVRGTEPYYLNRLADLTRRMYSNEPDVAAGRALLAAQVAGVYLKLHRYAEAVKLCRDVLRMIDDPALTNLMPKGQPEETASPERKRELQLFWKKRKLEAKARVHNTLGDIYKAQGDAQRSKEEYEQAARLASEANGR